MSRTTTGTGKGSEQIALVGLDRDQAAGSESPVVTEADSDWTDAPVGTRIVRAGTPRTPESEAMAARWELTLALHRRPAIRSAGPVKAPSARGRSEARPAVRRRPRRGKGSSAKSGQDPGDPEPEPPRRGWYLSSRAEIDAFFRERYATLSALYAAETQADGQLPLERHAA